MFLGPFFHRRSRKKKKKAPFSIRRRLLFTFRHLFLFAVAWIPGPLRPLDVTASLHTSSRVTRGTSLRSVKTRGTDLASVCPPHHNHTRETPDRGSAPYWRRWLGLFSQCWFAARDVSRKKKKKALSGLRRNFCLLVGTFGIRRRLNKTIRL